MSNDSVAKALVDKEFQDELAKWPSDAFRRCPYPFYDTLRSDAPVAQVREGVYFVSRWEDVVHVSQHPEIFSSRGDAAERQASIILERRGSDVDYDAAVSPYGLARCDAEEHRLKRGVAKRLVAEARLREIAPFVTATTHSLIDRFAGRGEVEFVSEFAILLPVYVMCELLGLPREDEARFVDYGQRLGPGSVEPFMTREQFETRREVGAAMYAYMREALLARHRHPRDDFLSAFIHDWEHDGEIPIDYLTAEANTLLIGGLATTQHLLTNTMLLLLQNPSERDRVLADRSLIGPMIEESLRVESPFYISEVRATQDTEIAGVPIPRGSVVYKLWAAANRDELKFDNPDEFCVGRSGVQKHHVAFGRGAHRCLGAPLAQLEGALAYDVLLERLRNIRLAPGKNNLEYVTMVGFRSVDELHLEFEERVPSA